MRPIRARVIVQSVHKCEVPHTCAGKLVRFKTMENRSYIARLAATYSSMVETCECALTSALVEAIPGVSRKPIPCHGRGRRFKSRRSPIDQPQDLFVRLTDGADKSRAIRVSTFTDVPYPYVRGYTDLIKSAPKTVSCSAGLLHYRQRSVGCGPRRPPLGLVRIRCRRDRRDRDRQHRNVLPLDRYEAQMILLPNGGSPVDRRVRSQLPAASHRI